MTKRTMKRPLPAIRTFRPTLLVVNRMTLPFLRGFGFPMGRLYSAYTRFDSLYIAVGRESQQGIKGYYENFLAPGVVLPVDLPEPLRGHVGVDLRRRDVGVPQHDLHGPQVRPARQKVP